VLWVIRNTKETDTVLDAWTGMGVFRPQAWYFGFVHRDKGRSNAQGHVQAHTEVLMSQAFDACFKESSVPDS